MAGMLPGVECARRRRIHQTGALSDSPTPPPYRFPRKSSSCLQVLSLFLYSSISLQRLYCVVIDYSYFLIWDVNILKQRSILDEACEDEELGGIAREAKKRLDERLRSQPKRQNSDENGMKGELQSKKKIVSWPKLSWRKC
ncbi:hypothetical protein Gotri_005382 [Gossypium trilobum]|uniref:Uncharacterized protein n=1 Tax=Gossypium trilobum TaxID=34281 RepID=A0A7J9EWF0_9ROSI|nr:hypothetical protein [Gossypium trilobum]